ncbi:MAG: hypothetical protein [Bacteriophage sp.]|nr:MAG: hypothetical protein [Bacteriophage sp.]
MAESNQSELYDSYMKVLAEINPLAPDAQGTTGARDYKYLKLSTLLAEIKPVFAKHHLGFYQSVDFELNAPQPWRIYNQPLNSKGRYSKDVQATMEQPIMISVVHTYIFNSTNSGEQVNHIRVGSYPVVMTGDPKANGSAVTYARRYSLFAALGIYPDPDDDGTAAQTQYMPQQAPQTTSPWQQAQRAAQAQQNPPQQPQQKLNRPQSQQQARPQQSSPAPPMQSDSSTGVTKDEADALWQLCKSVGVDLYTTASQIKGHKVTKLRELTKEDAQLVRARIDQALGTHYANA